MVGMRIGLIQSRGIGDIIIALPIAKYFFDRGHEIMWPVPEKFAQFFRLAAPYVDFLPLKMDANGLWMHSEPRRMLTERECDRIIPLYAAYDTGLGSHPELANRFFSAIHKFDEYKYAVSGVPFREKWNLSIVRDRVRENYLFNRVVNQDDFAVFHLRGSAGRFETDMAMLAGTGRQTIEITPLTDNPFDWLGVIERASLRIMLDSCFSNLTDQLGIPGEKIFIPRSPGQFTPVLGSDWRYLGQNPPIT